MACPYRQLGQLCAAVRPCDAVLSTLQCNWLLQENLLTRFANNK